MLPMISLIWGGLAFALLIPGFWPALIAVNWLDLPFAVAGLVLSVFAMLQSRNSGPALAGLIASLDAVIVGILRLVIGSSPL